MSLPNPRTAAAVPFVTATAPALLSAAFASSSRAKMFASVQVPAAGAAIADVSPAEVLDAAAVVSTALLSFLAQAAIASAAKARVAILNLGLLINMSSLLPARVKKNR